MEPQHDLLIVEELLHLGYELDDLPQLREAVLARLERLVVHRAELERELGHGDHRVRAEGRHDLLAQARGHLVGHAVDRVLRVALQSTE